MPASIRSIWVRQEGGPPLEEQDIIKLLLERSEQALIALAQKYERLCHRIAWNILNNDQDAEECVNDTYLGVWNTVPPQQPDP